MRERYRTGGTVGGHTAAFVQEYRMHLHRCAVVRTWSLMG